MKDQRRHPRYEVRVKVGFPSARSFVEQYANNLSEGGLFVASEVPFELGDRIEIQLELPESGSFDVDCRVAHRQREGEKPGVGLQIVEAPEGFHDALRRYLQVLSLRRDAWVLVGGLPAIADLLETAGFRVGQAPPPSGVIERLAQPPTVVALVGSHVRMERHRDVLAGSSFASLLVEVSPETTEAELFEELDGRLAQSTPDGIAELAL